MIYFIRLPKYGAVKIGFSARDGLKRRISNFQTHCPEPIDIMAVIEGDRGDETEIHKRFAAIRGRGEWFFDDGSIAKFVSAAEKVDHNYRPIETTNRLSEIIEGLKPGQSHVFLNSSYGSVRQTVSRIRKQRPDLIISSRKLDNGVEVYHHV